MKDYFLQRIEIRSDRPIFYPVNGQPVTGPGTLLTERSSLAAPTNIRLVTTVGERYLLGTYSAENAALEMDYIREAIYNNAPTVFMMDESIEGEPVEVKNNGADGKKYPSNQKRNREKVMAIIKNNPDNNNNTLAKLAGVSWHTIERYRATLNGDPEGK